MILSKLISELLLTVITLLLLTFIILFYIPKINNEYILVVEKIINEIHKTIANNDFNSLKKINIPPSSIIVLWLKKEQNNWLPILTTENYNNLLKEDPTKLPLNISYKIIKYHTIKSNNFEYYAWINRFNYQFIVRKLLILFLLLSISYIALIIIIELLFLPITSSVSTNANNGNYSQINNKEILDEYRSLWNKNFKVSDQFKNDTNFLDIFKKMSLTITKEEYLEFCIEKFKKLFKIEEVNFFIGNVKKFLDIKNKTSITENNIKIATSTENKGDIYIPLFPYKLKNIFGYFYFKWEQQENFNINEILYFLKFIFSYKIKPIFLFWQKINKLIKVLSETVIKNNNLTICLITIDKLEFLFSSLTTEICTQLNNKIKSLLIKKIPKIVFIQIDLFYYLLVTKKDKEKLVNEISSFLTDENNQVFETDKGKDNIAITYSASVVSSKNRNIHAITLLKEAEDLLKQAELNGGNQILK